MRSAAVSIRFSPLRRSDGSVYWWMAYHDRASSNGYGGPTAWLAVLTCLRAES